MSARFCLGETDEQRVIDFYRTIGSPYFGAVVSAWDINTSTSGSSCWPGMEPRPTLVTLVGELDVSTVPLLRQCFAHIEGDIDVDCSGLDYVDVARFGNLCLRRRTVRACRCQVRPR